MIPQGQPLRQACREVDLRRRWQEGECDHSDLEEECDQQVLPTDEAYAMHTDESILEAMKLGDEALLAGVAPSSKRHPR